MTMQATAFPRFVEIQTVTACNAACTVCPHPDVHATLPRGIMSQELFTRLIDECAPHQDGMTIAPYLNGEPFLDRRLAERIRYINDHCPRANVEVSTNVSLLDTRARERLHGLRIDELRLSVFGFTAGTHQLTMPGLRFDRVMENLAGLAEDHLLRAAVGHVGVVLLDHPAVSEQDVARAERFCADNGFELYRWGVLDRSRNVAGISNGIYRDRVVGCDQRRHLERLHVRFDGTVILCCQDWRAEMVLGSLDSTSIAELWHSPAYNKARESIQSGLPGAAPDLCRRCIISIPG